MIRFFDQCKSVLLQITILGTFCLSSVVIAEEAITNPYRIDGFGAQFQTIIYSIIYAELNHKTFLYTPFKSLEHNYDHDIDFSEKMENLANIIDHFPINHDPKLQKKNKVLFINFFEKNLNACVNSNSLKKLKKIFRENKDRENYFPNDNLNIAVHVRRPNSHDSRIAGANTPDKVYIDVIERLRKEYHTGNPLFHIYSQGDEEEFKKIYKGDDIVLHIDTSIEDSFTSMVLADVLVTSCSSFSYTAAILSEGTVYYMRFWHPPLPGWIEIKP